MGSNECGQDRLSAAATLGGARGRGAGCMTKPAVLVVDDEPISCELIAHALEHIADVGFARDGHEALASVVSACPELVLLDNRMPGLDGIAVCSALKADPRTRHVPIVFVSAATDEAEEARGLLAGAVEYVAKPIRPALLAARVKNLLELSRCRDRSEIEATFDEVSGLGGRRRVEQGLALEWRKAARTGRPLSLALVALDKLDQVEQLFGPRVVEDMLERVAHALASALEGGERLVERFTGDRFAVVLVDTDELEAAALAERLRLAVERLGLRALEGAILTASVGVATARPAAAPSPSELVVRASKRLAEAVGQGGNVSSAGSAPPPRVAPSRVTGGAPLAKLLVVDDDPIAVEILVELATRGGHDVVVATTGAEAVGLMTSARPDVVLLDVELGDDDGFEVCRALKAMPEAAHVPVIFLSARTDAGDKVRAFEVGGADYVGKPFEPREVLARVAHQVKITRLQREMRLAHERLLELDRLKASFVAMLVHDLRSPLTVVETTLGFVASRVGGDRDAAELVGLATEAMDASLSLIAEVLEIYRAESTTTRAPPSQGDVAQVVRRCVGAAEVVARRGGVELEARIEEPLLARLDAPRFARAINNMLGNALKFSRRGARVFVDARVVPYPSGARVRVEVRDQGPGIDEVELPFIFELYHQAERRHRGGGFGLGLPIVKRIVDDHGGEVTVHSRPGVGTAFVIELPVAS